MLRGVIEATKIADEECKQVDKKIRKHLQTKINYKIFCLVAKLTEENGLENKDRMLIGEALIMAVGESKRIAKIIDVNLTSHLN